MTSTELFRSDMAKQDAKILIADDELDILELIRHSLSKEGFEVHVASNGAQALEIAKAITPDLIILDVMMPVINGFNFCKLLKKEAKQKESAIIMVTSRDEIEDIQIGMEMGADAYLTKPINISEFLSEVSFRDANMSLPAPSTFF